MGDSIQKKLELVPTFSDFSVKFIIRFGNDNLGRFDFRTSIKHPKSSVVGFNRNKSTLNL